MDERYDPKSFESNWTARWEADGIYVAPRKPAKGRSKRFIMGMFPYPSGDLHLGHVENYSIEDAVARYWRMSGFDVMHPIGFDAFGLPAEEAAMLRKAEPKEWTLRNIDEMRASFRRLGLSYDWTREFITCEPEYYRWNQWIFLKMLERGLTYRKKAPVNWCPSCKTVLANEQTQGGVCWKCSSTPQIRDLTQWYLKTTAYADELLDDMASLSWSDSILNQQKNWIGRSRGAEVLFIVKRGDDTFPVPVFTTRPDTLWGVTSLVLAPEHPVASELVSGTDVEDTFRKFLDETRLKSEVDRQSSGETRQGMALPAIAINPANDEEVVVWVADYVLMGYGSGAVMSVPAHDQRDFEFARKYGLSVRPVIQPEGDTLEGATMTEAYTGPGVMTHSGPLSGTTIFPDTKEGIESVIDWLSANDKGHGTINYRLHDWGFSRQRYWGTPIPIIYCDSCGQVPVPYEDLPILLPEKADFSPSEDAGGPLANVAEWVNTKCPSCGADGKRETHTMDTFFDSAWYFLRYCDPGNEDVPFDPDLVAAWGPVDQYVGGTEHAVGHLIYARFFTKVFHDMGLVPFSEPFVSLFNQGNVTLDGREMSKSSGHLVEAAETIERFGADAARTFILFCSPPAAPYDFPADGMAEIGRVAFSWLSRVWRVLSLVDDSAMSQDLERAVHRAVKAATEDFENYGFNTAIARMMELVNEFSKLKGPVPRVAAETLLKLLAPIAPFITEELWHRYGNESSIHLESWPTFDPALLTEKTVTMVIQVNGKVRDTVDVDVDISREQMQELALASDKVRPHLSGEPRRVVIVPPRLINIVV
ncbi:MAG: leucine--tRNA ligase [Actinomycetota bacterium]